MQSNDVMESALLPGSTPLIFFSCFFGILQATKTVVEAWGQGWDGKMFVFYQKLVFLENPRFASVHY
jgi:hypothetical protein